MRVNRLPSIIISIILVALMAVQMCAFSVVEPDGTEHFVYITNPETRKDSSTNKYNKLMSIWSKDGKNSEFANMNYPDFYGGMWLGDDGGLEIAVVGLNEQKKKYFSDIIDITDVTFVEAKYSYSAIYLENKRISELMTNPKTEAEKAIGGVGIGKNTIFIMFNCDSMAQAEKYAESITSFDVVVQTGMIISVEEPVECVDVFSEVQ